MAVARKLGLIAYASAWTVSDTPVAIRCVGTLDLEHPFYGSGQMARHLRREGVVAGRHRVRRLMRLMGMEAVYRKPRTSVANPEHRVYPYLRSTVCSFALHGAQRGTPTVVASDSHSCVADQILFLATSCRDSPIHSWASHYNRKTRQSP